MANSLNDVLRVNLLTVSPHNKAILEFFFSGAGSSLYQMSDAEQADIFILDYDHMGALDDWERVSQQDKRPCIMLSVHELKLENTLWVAKPLTSKALLDAATDAWGLVARKPGEQGGGVSTPASGLASSTEQVKMPVQPFGVGLRQKMPSRRNVPVAPERSAPKLPPMASPMASSPPAAPIADNASLVRLDATPVDQVLDETVDPVKQQQRWDLLCGTRVDSQPDQLAEDGGFVDLSQYLVDYLRRALHQAQASKAKILLRINPDHYLLLMPDVHQSYCTLDLYSQQFAELCQQPVSPEQVTIHASNEPEMQVVEESNGMTGWLRYDLEAFIWSATLLTCQGRLGHVTNIKQLYRLKHWPNLTRLEQIPHIMRIAATWNQHSGSIFDVSERLQIPQRHVFSFHSAASALNLFELMDKDSAVAAQADKKPRKNRGLFSRILKRLLGGAG